MIDTRSACIPQALVRRSVTLATMGSQRAELSLRRASRMALRHRQFQEVQRLLQEAIGEREREREQAQAQAHADNEGQGQGQADQNVNIVISEHEEVDEHSNPYGLEF